MGNSMVPINEQMSENNADNIKNLIYYIRGKYVMLDSDVAMLYHYETKKINQTVKRNIERFPEKFCFQLTENEVNNNWSQFVTGSNNHNNKHRGKKYLPYAFTEQGIAMLSGLLKNEIAVQVSINIMDAFVKMRKFLNQNSQIFSRLTNVEYKLLKHDNKINQVLDELQKYKREEFKQKIFFKGEIWDSYELIIEIIKSAKNKIIIIDNYIDYTILKMLQRKNKNVEAVILTSQNSPITKLDIKKFNEQYPVLKIARTNLFHDRFIIIDNKEMYHCGASLKDLGKKCFGINKMEEGYMIENMINFIENILQNKKT